MTLTFGHWPIDAFRALPSEIQTEFWQSESSDRDSLVENLSRSVAKHRVKVDSELFKGQYLPLSVYKTQGFDIDFIVQKCHDIEEHEVLGKTYRVDIHTMEEGQIKQEVDKELMLLRGTKRKAAEDKKKDNKKRKQRSSSSSSDSSSSSGDSDENKQNKKTKEDKKHKPEVEAEEPRMTVKALPRVHACMCSGVDRSYTSVQAVPTADQTA